MDVRQLTIIGSMELQPDNGPSSDDEVGSRREFARRFAEGIGKLTGNTKGDHWEEDRRTCHKNARGYRIMWDSLGDSPKGSGSLLGTRREIDENKTRGLATRMPEAAELCGSSGQRLTVGKPPRSTGEPPIPKFSGYDWILASVLKPIWGL
ncbi:hypothetical protein B296_00013131 [Ensete ventricosum]|uniref:Uncharacterized protein n=1 Tax=Ensete ventricosum TaxID=4639 RepID=A0A426YSZ8_ENSVE|nr:hypothetical protein B296_00013131 [Ensete ventricosum]